MSRTDPRAGAAGPTRAVPSQGSLRAHTEVP